MPDDADGLRTLDTTGLTADDANDGGALSDDAPESLDWLGDNSDESDGSLSEPLDRDKLLSERLDPDDERLDDSDELRSVLLGSELLGQLDDERSDEPLLDGELPLTFELRELPTDELHSELEPPLPEDSLDELGEDRDDSLTLENDLLDP